VRPASKKKHTASSHALSVIQTLVPHHFSPPPRILKTGNNVVKLQLHLQPVKQQKLGLRPQQRQQQHWSPVRQQDPRTRHRPSIPTDARRQPGNLAQHPGHNPPLAQRNNRSKHTVRHKRSEHTRSRNQRRTPSPHSGWQSPELTSPRSNTEHAGHDNHEHWLDSRTTRY